MACRNRFLQRLEGPQAAVDALLERINRSFTDWSQLIVMTKPNGVDELDALLRNVEIRKHQGLNDQEAQFIVNYIKRHALPNTTANS